jgi:hypothetical protein
MNKQEKDFIISIENKIKKYNIPITLKKVLNYYSGNFVYTEYNNGNTELVDAKIEKALCTLSPLYFIINYGWIEFPGKGVIPYNLYYFQKEVLKDTPKFKKMVFLKSRQCLTEDNYVMTSRGYISIKDVKIGDKIETIKDGISVFVEVKDSFYTGKRKTCRIMINSGITINCTLDHKIYTKRGWIEAKDITLNDEIVSLINQGNFGNFKLEKDEHAALIGYYLADGRSSAPSFVNTNIDYINEVLEIGKTFKNCYPYIHKRKMNKKSKLQRYDVRLVSNSKNIHLDRPIKDFLNRFGLNVLSENRILTNELMNLNKKQMSILINRLYAGDGWITYTRISKRPNYITYEIGIGAPNYTLIKQLEYILQTKYGIHGWIIETTDNRISYGKKFWKFKITQKKSVIKFIEEIGIKGKTDTKEIKDLIPKESPYKSHQSFEKIRKIEEKEELEDVYDITTESSDFLTNGLLVHNCGISTLYSLYSFWKGNFFEGENIDVISIKQKKAQAFTKKMYPTMDRLPIFLKTPTIKRNTMEVEWENGSYMLSESASEKAGRGDSLSLLIMDELAFYLSDRLTRGIVSAAQPTLTRTGGNQILISTPNSSSGSGSYYYEQVQQLLLSGGETNTEKLVEIDWYEVPDIKGIKPYKGYNKKLEEYIKKDYYRNKNIRKEMKKFFGSIFENWKENDWLKKQHDDLGDILFKQEIGHSFVVSGDQVFVDETLEAVKERIKEPIEENKLGKTRINGLWIWKHPIPKQRYILGVDSATGTGNDFSTIQVMNVENYEQVAEYKGQIATKTFGKLVKKIARYYNEGFVVIEANSIGEAVFNEVYYNEQDSYQNVFKTKKSKNGITRMTGWENNVKTRQLMINNLIDWLTIDDLFNELKFYSKRLYQEMLTFVWRNGRADHTENSHDDTLIAFGLCLYFRNKAESARESFLINEDGDFIGTNDKKDLEDVKLNNNGFDFVSNDEEDFEENMGLTLEDYEWIIG